MARFSKLVLVLVAIVAVFIGLIGSSVKDTEAGGGPSIFRFEVNTGLKASDGWKYSSVTLRSDDTLQIERGASFRVGTSSTIVTTVGPTTTEAQYAADPSWSSAADGFWVKYPESTTSLAQLVWRVENCTKGPKVAFSIGKPNQTGSSGKILIDNTSNQKLFVSTDNGRSWSSLAIGDYLSTGGSTMGEVFVHTAPNLEMSSTCSVARWNTNPPSPTPSPTPVSPVAFSMGTAITGQVGTYVNVPVSIVEGSPVSYVGVVVKYDPSALQLAAFPNAPCNLGSVRNRQWSNNLVEMDFVPSQPIVANCKILVQFKVLKEGETTLTFVKEATTNGFRTVANNGSVAVPFTTANGSVIGKPLPAITATITTASTNWPTYESGGYRAGDVRVQISSSQMFNARYSIEYNGPGCRINFIMPGYNYWTGMKTSHTGDHGIYLLDSAQGRCDMTVVGYTTAGSNFRSNTLTVWVRPPAPVPSNHNQQENAGADVS